MADWSLPVLGSDYSDVLDYLKAREVDALTLCYAAPTNPPTGAIAYVRASNKFQEYNGATWDDKVIAIAGGGTGASSASAARTSLGLGTIATQNSNAVTITGGTISGTNLSAADVTSGTLALARGGTGASLALGANGTFLMSNGAAVVFTLIPAISSTYFTSLSGANLTSLNATNISSGTLDNARLTSNVLLDSGSYSNPSWLTALAGSKITGTAPTLIDITVTPVTGSTTGEDDLQSLVIAGGTLPTNGWMLRIYARVQFANNTNVKQAKVYFGSTYIALMGPDVFQNQTWFFELNVIRINATTQYCSGFWYGSGGGVPFGNRQVTASETLANDITIKVTGDDGVDVTSQILGYSIIKTGA